MEKAIASSSYLPLGSGDGQAPRRPHRRRGAPTGGLASGGGVETGHPLARSQPDLPPARHAIAPAGAGAMVRDHGHVTALEQAALAASTNQRPHRGKERRPPSQAAHAHAAALRAGSHRAEPAANDAVIDLATYAAAATGRKGLLHERVTVSVRPPG